MIRMDGNRSPDPSFPKSPVQLENPGASGAARPDPLWGQSQKTGQPSPSRHRAPVLVPGKLGGVWGNFWGILQREVSVFAQLRGISLTHSLELGLAETTAPELGNGF